ncbi:glycosyltransferase family 2 protein [Carnobacterium viridans]|uniref:Glycosyltransferase involved in cell wall bisynthesis n=1 Tax=Carnobacterium viridans TaxID=174587 RepID=A0A1H0YYK6_9LACT|nr:glycosyltransferase family 2 protein [Carnobacterium viridans]UDE94880.1 glycosyltransferase family 2 protein [Carnobacterium viridans]SDQ20279.1 Glycosyltransferase involved in cell wall bisynthesis [Carnobacterium viridans]
MKTITILIPAYNEEAVIDKMYEKLDSVCGGLSQHTFEFLFVNDGSTDRTLEQIKAFKKKDSRVQYVDLSRNFGKETAMLAGFDYAKGDALIIIDADLQQPPETFAEMIHWWEEGYDDVYAVRKEREGETWLKKWTSDMYYRVLQKVAKVKVYPQAGDFRLLDKKCVAALTQLREHERYTKGMYGWIGFKKKEISYIAEARAAGETKWKLSALMNLALNGITSYSTMPLRIWSIIGFIISMFAFVYLTIEIIRTMIFGTSVAGYPSLIAGILFLGGIQLISLGIIGEYLGRVFVETKERPVYFIQEYSEKELKKEMDVQDDKN